MCGLNVCKCSTGIVPYAEWLQKEYFSDLTKGCEGCIHNKYEYSFVQCLDCDDDYSGYEEDIKDGKSDKVDNVNSPSHYTTGNIECIDYIFDTIADPESFCVGNVLKYVSRYKHKNGIEDLQKARYYLDKVIGLMED